MKDYEQIISTLLARIADLEKLVAQQAAEISELKRRLNKDSSNSSKPLSSDWLKKSSRTSSLREKGKHTSGGQKGHKGTTLKQVSHPDHIVTLTPQVRHPVCLEGSHYVHYIAIFGRSRTVFGMTCNHFGKKSF